ncbi:MAG: hypothetical protein ACRD15_23310 [Vicinamibacterales bacterium]
MRAARARRHAVAVFGYVSVAVVFAWPLPMHLGTGLLGAPGGDTGVYLWNLWVFRHEIVAHGRFPFFTLEILAASPSAVPLTLHNYTTAANLLGFPLQQLIGTVAAFNLLTLASCALSAYVMFLFLRERVGDDPAAWIGGLLFGFSPFMTARQMAHFSLVQAAALPAFALLMYRFRVSAPTIRRAVAGGAIVAWAFLSDPYYAVYCAMMAVFLLVWEALAVEGRREAVSFPFRVSLDIAIMCLAGMVAAIVLRGGGRFEIFGLRVSMTRLYTPMLIVTVLVAVRAWMAIRPRISWHFRPLKRFLLAGAVGGLTCAALLSPVLSAMGSHLGEGRWISPKVWWRSSAPGVDLLAFLVPNPVGSLFGWVASGWLSAMPDGLHENVASIPWTATFAVAVALLYTGLRLPAYWTAFTGAMAILALGPFVHIAGWNTYVPAPWALFRYLPVIGASRMPTRLTVLVMLGVSVLLACAVRSLRERSRRPWLPPVLVGSLLLIELMPAPRTIHNARVPAFYATIAADPRDVRVLHLPFGLRDGLTSTGDFSAYAQFLQTFHEKPLIGGYLSRLPGGGVTRYRRIRLFRLLFDLSERRPVSPDRMESAIEQAHDEAPPLQIGYVVVDTTRASPQLIAFAKSALDLQRIATEQGQELYIVR